MLSLLKSDVFSKFVVSGAVRFLVVIASVVFSFYVSRVYGLATLGAFTLSIAIVIGLSLFNRLGFDKSILKLAGSLDERDSTFYQTLRNTLIMTFSLGALIVLIAWPLNQIMSDANPQTASYLRFMLFTIPFVGVNFVLAQYFNGIRKPYISPLFEPSGYLASLAILVIATNMLTGNPLSFELVVRLYVLLAVVVSICGAAFIFSRKHEVVGAQRSLLQTFSHYRHENIDFFLASLSAYLITLGLFPLIGLFLSNAEVGFFRLCERISSTIGFVLIIINNVLAPRYSNAWKKMQYQHLFKTYCWSVLLSMVIALPLLVLIYIFGDRIIGLAAPDKTDIIRMDVLRILVFASFINVLAGGVQLILNMTGHHNIARNISVFMLIFGIVLFGVFSSTLGLKGAAIAYLIYIITFNSLGFVSVRKRVFRKRLTTPPGNKHVSD